MARFVASGQVDGICDRDSYQEDGHCRPNQTRSANANPMCIREIFS